MRRIMTLISAVCAVGLAFAGGERSLSADGKTLTFNVSEGQVYDNTTPIESTVTEIVKIGGGEACLLTQTNTTFSGAISIKAGFLSGNHRSFGTPSAITVESDPSTGVGGAFVLLDQFPGSIYTTQSPFYNTKFTISGNGPDKGGAIQRLNAHSDHVWIGLMKDLELAGDATINASTRWGLGGSVLNMNGHQLALSAAKLKHRELPSSSSTSYSAFHLTRYGLATYIKNPGSIVVEGTNSAKLMIEDNGKILDAEGSSGSVRDLVVTIRQGAQFQTYSQPSPESAATFKVRYESNVIHRANGTAYFGGLMEMIGSQLTLSSYNSLSCNLHLTGGLTGPDAKLVVNATNERGLYSFGGDVAHTNRIANFNNNTRNVLEMTGKDIFVVTNVSYCGFSDIATPAHLRVSGDAKLLTEDAVRLTTPENDRILLGYNGYGILEIRDNAVVSNVVDIGQLANSHAAVYLNGGRFDQLHRVGDPDVVNIGSSAANGYGCMVMAGGTYCESVALNLGKSTPRAFFVQRGGISELAGAGKPVRLGWSGEGYSTYAQFGGQSLWKNYAVFGYKSTKPDAVSLIGALTVDGPDTVMDFSQVKYGNMDIGIIFNASIDESKPCVATVNINNGGTLRVKQMYRSQITASDSPTWDSIKEKAVKGGLVYINFNGGVLKAAKGGEFFNSYNDSWREPNSIVVYEKGAVIDTDGYEVIWRKAFSKPTGKGIKKVSLPPELAAVSATNLLIGPTRAVIGTTSGKGADLLMAYDETTRRATNVIVNARGFGFTETPTVKFETAAANGAYFSNCSVEMVDFDTADFKDGGLTKRGAGTLKITAINTYCGPTRLEGGTLDFRVSKSLPSGSALEFAAAGILSGAKDEPLLIASEYTGGYIRVTEADLLDADTFGGYRTIATFRTPLASVPQMTLVNSDGTVCPAGRWKLAVSADGTSLRFGVRSGLAILVR